MRAKEQLRVGYMINELTKLKNYRKTQIKIKERLKSLDIDMPLTTLEVLGFIGVTPRKSSDIAKSLILEPGFVSKALKRLESRGYVTYHRRNADRRNSFYTLTKEGDQVKTAIEERLSA